LASLLSLVSVPPNTLQILSKRSCNVVKQQLSIKPITDDYVDDVWDECHCCCCCHNPPALIWPTQYTADMGCNMWSLCQWDDATSPISIIIVIIIIIIIFSMEKPVMYLPTYLVAQFSSLKASRRCKQLEGGVKRKPYLLTYLVNHLRGGLKGRWQQLTFTHL
jgi:hypothetical protein